MDLPEDQARFSVDPRCTSFVYGPLLSFACAKELRSRGVNSKTHVFDPFLNGTAARRPWIHFSWASETSTPHLGGVSRHLHGRLRTAGDILLDSDVITGRGPTEVSNEEAPKPNRQLRAHMDRKGLSAQGLADLIGVDAKTVERWLAGVTVPYSHNARRVAEVLDCDPADLWPDLFPIMAPPSAGTVAVSVYSSRADIPPSVWR